MYLEQEPLFIVALALAGGTLAANLLQVCVSVWQCRRAEALELYHRADALRAGPYDADPHAQIYRA